MSLLVQTTVEIPVRHIVNGIPVEHQLPAGTVCQLVGDEAIPGTYMLLVWDVNSVYYDEECWFVPPENFQPWEVTP